MVASTSSTCPSRKAEPSSGRPPVHQRHRPPRCRTRGAPSFAAPPAAPRQTVRAGTHWSAHEPEGRKANASRVKENKEGIRSCDIAGLREAGAIARSRPGPLRSAGSSIIDGLRKPARTRRANLDSENAVMRSRKPASSPFPLLHRLSKRSAQARQDRTREGIDDARPWPLTRARGASREPDGVQHRQARLARRESRRHIPGAAALDRALHRHHSSITHEAQGIAP